MSETYNIVCDDCRVSLWIGQGGHGDPKSFRIYGAEGDRQQPVAEFLMAHESHALRFLSENKLSIDRACDYTELDGDKPGLPPGVDIT